MAQLDCQDHDRVGAYWALSWALRGERRGVVCSAGRFGRLDTARVVCPGARV